MHTRSLPVGAASRAEPRRRRRSALVALLAVVALLASLAPSALAPRAEALEDPRAWPQYLSDGANTWRSDASGPADPGYKWFVDYDELSTLEAPDGYSLSAGRRGSGMPVAADGTLVLRARNNDSGSGSVIGVDADDGSVLWEIPGVYDSFGACEPAIDSRGRVWLQPRGVREVVAHDLADGSEIAGTRLEVDAACGSAAVHVAADGDGGEWLVLPGGSSGPDFVPSAPPEDFTVVDVAGAQPEIAWTFDGDNPAPFDGTVGVSRSGTGGASSFFPRPVVASDDAIYLVGWTDDGDEGSHEIFEFGLSDGALRSRTDAPAPAFDADLDDAPIAATDYRRWQLMLTGDDELVVGPWTGSSDAFVAVYDVSAGLPADPTWLERFPGSSQPGRLALGNGVVHVQPGGSGTISGLSLAAGAAQWESEFSDGPGISTLGTESSIAPVDADGAFYSRGNLTGGSSSRDLVKHDAQGRIAWWFHESSAAEAARADLGDPDLGLSFGNLTIGGIDDDGTIYLANRQAEWLLAIDGSGGLSEAVEDDDEDRLAGDGRVETAVEISQVFDSADTVLLARSDDYADALAGAPLAAALEAPILLTPPTSLAPVVAGEIQRLGASQARLLGGNAALSASVEASLNTAGVATSRYAGANRFATAAQIADDLPEPSGNAFVVEGRNADASRGWPDAVSVSALAAFSQSPILLAERDRLPAETFQALESPAILDATIVGGFAAVSAGTETLVNEAIFDASRVRRIAGADRYETSAAVAEESVLFGMNATNTWTATGRDFPDALAAAPVAGATAPEIADEGGVLLLVDGLDLDRSDASRDWLADNATAIERIRAVGGTAVITDATLDAMRGAAGID